MSHKISTEWFSPTEEMVSYIEHSNSDYSYYKWNFIGNAAERSVKFKMKYKDMVATYPSHCEFAAADISKDKKTVTLKFPLNTKEKKLYDSTSWRDRDEILGEDFDEKNYITISYEEFLNEVQFQYTGVDKYNSICDHIEIGDFVQFSGQRDKKSWRKVMKIEWENNSIFGWKYHQPIDEDGYDSRNASDNMITTVTALVKNPKK